MTATSGRPIDRSKDTAILLAARKLLIQDGVPAVTMEAVATEAGVSKATLYSRYGNRNELIEAVLRAQSDFFIESLNPDIRNPDQLVEALVSFSVRLLEFLCSDDHICLMNTLHGHQGMPDDLRHRMYELGPQATSDEFQQWLAKASTAGLLYCPEPEASGELLFGMLVGMDMLRRIFQQPPKHAGAHIESHVRKVIGVFMRMHQIPEPQICG
jgi:TetR/AcrR family transcriptional repressor of mexJK operon